jgi:hypothetical protein
MPPLDTEGYDTAKSISTFTNLASIALGTFVPQAYNFNAIKRLVHVDSDDESVTPTTAEDPLSALLVEAAENMSFIERDGASEIEITPSASLASLFDRRSPVAKALRPRLLLAFDLHASASICGFCSACDWTEDASLGTERWSASALEKVGAPRFDTKWLLIDVVASRKRGTGALLVLAIYLTVCRSKQYRGVCCTAVSKSGKSLFTALGFQTRAYRDKGAKALCWAATDSLSMEHISKRLRFDGDEALLSGICWRLGLTPKTSSRVVGRC